MNKKLVICAALLGLAGCDKAAEPKVQAVVRAMPAEVPKQNGQYLRFYQMANGETRLEAHRVAGQLKTVISGNPGFVVEPGKFPAVNPVLVRIKDCGLITFTQDKGNPQAMTAKRTDKQGFNAQCPIQNLDGLWVKLSVSV